MFHIIRKAGCTILIVIFCSIILSCSSSKPDYSLLCKSIETLDKSNNKSHLFIYLDVSACLTCAEDMNAWIKLEDNISDCGGTLSLWTSRKDSFDVAVAMRLEGLKTPVRVLNEDVLQALKWENIPTPIKVLLDNNCKIKQILGPPKGKIDSRMMIDSLIKDICL